MRAEEYRGLISEFDETRSISAIGEGIASAFDFAEGDFNGLSVSALTGHVFLAGRRNFTLGLALGQMQVDGDRSHLASLEAAVKARSISLYASAGRRFLSRGAPTFAEVGLKLPLEAGLKIVFGMGYESLGGSKEFRVAFAANASSNTRWEPFFEAGGSGQDMHAIGGFRIVLGPINRKGAPVTEVFEAIPNAAANEIRAHTKNGNNEEDTLASNTASTETKPTQELNPGRSKASTRKQSESGSQARIPAAARARSHGDRVPNRLRQ